MNAKLMLLLCFTTLCNTFIIGQQLKQGILIAIEGAESPEKLSLRVCNAIEQWLKINNMLH